MGKGSTRLRRGSIVWATTSDPRGQNPKKRPIVILSADNDIRAGAHLDGVAVSSTIPDPPPPECVELPWDQKGTAPTGFRRRCVAVCNWGVHVAFEAVEATGKHVPPRVVSQILERIAHLKAKAPKSP